MADKFGCMSFNSDYSNLFYAVDRRERRPIEFLIKESTHIRVWMPYAIYLHSICRLCSSTIVPTSTHPHICLPPLILNSVPIVSSSAPCRLYISRLSNKSPKMASTYKSNNSLSLCSLCIVPAHPAATALAFEVYYLIKDFHISQYLSWMLLRVSVIT